MQHQVFTMHRIGRTNLLSNVDVVTLSKFCTNFQVFAHFALQSSLMMLYFSYVFCKNIPEITHQYFCLLPSFFTWNIWSIYITLGWKWYRLLL